MIKYGRVVQIEQIPKCVITIDLITPDRILSRYDIQRMIPYKIFIFFFSISRNYLEIHCINCIGLYVTKSICNVITDKNTEK